MSSTGATGTVARPPGGTTEASGRVGRLRGDRAFGAVLVALWVAWLVLTLLTQTRLVTSDRLVDDLAAGRVVAWRVVQLDTSDDGRAWSHGVEYSLTDVTDDVDAAFSEPGSPAIAYWTDGWFAPARVLDPNGLTVGPPDVRERLLAAGVPTLERLEDAPSVTADRRQNWTAWAGAPLLLLTLGSIVGGRAPTRGTRWFWFWQTWVTFGLGVLAYAMLEQLRPAPAPGTVGAPARLGGWRGLGISILGSLVVAASADLLASNTHWLWLLRP
ncbi:hypothetical protein [Phycicoccus sonneratiae]|uniref:DUF3592 domain-containing protein n=1 Tax=Phycicoccus sonneratiae TaxID=2807628 RepID=A0ABS2CRQ8_9MICO|nr:hypothetical protein [Phycicoccus sonneraticus]MBM6402556.1 hypothetical protein [Phycicoccus sonneraticus]